MLAGGLEHSPGVFKKAIMTLEEAQDKIRRQGIVIDRLKTIINDYKKIIQELEIENSTYRINREAAKMEIPPIIQLKSKKGK